MDIGDFYLATASRYGSIELAPGVMLSTGRFLNAQGAKDESGKPLFEPKGFYFQENNIVTECYGQENVKDFLDDRKKSGFVLPISWETVGPEVIQKPCKY